MVLAFTDRSVAGESCFGEGGCGVLIFSKEKGVIARKSVKGGSVVDNVACEVEGILMSLELICKFSIENPSRKSVMHSQTANQHLIYWFTKRVLGKNREIVEND